MQNPDSPQIEELKKQSQLFQLQMQTLEARDRLNNLLLILANAHAAGELEQVALKLLVDNKLVEAPAEKSE